ncbi:hypothetical protein [Rufibacter soli]
MLDQDLKNLWQNSPSRESIHVNQTLLLQQVNQEADALARKIKIRDRLEIGVALVMMPLFGVVAWFIPFALTKLGAALVVVWCGWVVSKLRKARRHGTQDPSLPLDQFLLQYRGYLQRQVQLLKGVLYWYLLPFSGCMLLFFAGFPLGARQLLGPGAVVLAMNVLVYFLNKLAVQKELQPQLDKVNQTLAALEK